MKWEEVMGTVWMAGGEVCFEGVCAACGDTGENEAAKGV